MSHAETVRKLFSLLARGSAGHDEALALFAPDARYWMNAWREPQTGTEAIRAELERQLTQFDDLSSTIVRLSQNAEHVTLERHDTMVIGGRKVTLHFAGWFVFDEHGRIAEWKDWFDTAEITHLMGAAS